MRFIHLSDLHLGKRVGGYSMIEDQVYILDRIMDIISEENPDIIIISGDVYDKLSPPVEAVTLLDDFLTRLSDKGLRTFIIAGNHDSPERIAFGANLMNRSGVHFSPIYNGKSERFTVSDEFGDVDIYLLPFLRAAEARRFFPDEGIETAADAVRVAIKNMNIDMSRRNIIISHQFVEGGEQSDSERASVGGTDGVPAELYMDFDYAALGHLHKAQCMTDNKIRYGGTPLKYSISEAKKPKYVTVCELREKGAPVTVDLRELVPLRDMRELEGSFDELMQGGSDDYVEVRLTDEERVPDAQKRLRTLYPNIMGVRYTREEKYSPIGDVPDSDVRQASPFELFERFFSDANGRDMSEEQSAFMLGLVNKIWG